MGQVVGQQWARTPESKSSASRDPLFSVVERHFVVLRAFSFIPHQVSVVTIPIWGISTAGFSRLSILHNVHMTEPDFSSDMLVF